LPKRVAVVLLNLGGPDGLPAVRPFLFNLFYDPAIIRLPNPLRWLVAKLISMLRTRKAQGIYAQMGGASPLLSHTQMQVTALESALNKGTDVFKVFVAMRYWHPLTAEVVRKVKLFAPTQVILLPLYPQFSTTTTASSFNAWHEEAYQQGLAVPTYTPCCFAREPHFIKAHADLLTKMLSNAAAYGVPKVLFSAHSLPQKVIEGGDPYQWQVEQTAKAIAQAVGPIDYTVCYQSRATPVKWLEPSTQAEIKKASQGGRPVVVVPIAFVSDHSETLIELDKEYHLEALNEGAPFYGRVPSLGTHPLFIEALHAIITQAMQGGSALGPLCPPEFKQCLCQGVA
jgi:ferrochelatase